MLCIKFVVGIEKHVTALISDNAIVNKLFEICFEYSLIYFRVIPLLIFFPSY